MSENDKDLDVPASEEDVQNPGDNLDDLDADLDDSEEPVDDSKADEKISKLEDTNKNLLEALRQERIKNREITPEPVDKPVIGDEPAAAEADEYYLTNKDAKKLSDESAKKALATYKEEARKKAERSALKQFYAKYPIYDPINDPEGVMWSLLSNKVAIKGDSENEILEALEDAHYLLDRTRTSKSVMETPFTDDAVGPSSKKTEDIEETPKLTAEQKKIAKGFGMSEKEYLERLSK